MQSHCDFHLLQSTPNMPIFSSWTLRVRNYNISERLKVENITKRCRKARLKWVGHVMRRDQEYIGRKTTEMAQPGRRRRGRLNTETEMDGLCQPRYESYQDNIR